MKRYNQVHNGTYEPRSEMIEETLGDWVWYEDVERLEEERQELLGALEELVEGDEIDSWSRARAAIAKAKGEA